MTVIAPGLPNIEFGFGLQYPTTDGYILNGNINAAQINYGSAIRSFGNVSSLVFNASLANSVYGNSTTVQPPSIVLIPQIKY